MTQSSRLAIGIVRESTAGTTPTTPRMRTLRVTGENLSFAPTYVDSDEIRSDRMNAAPILVMKDSGGSIPFELTYPEDLSPLSEFYRSAFFSTWTNTATRDNDGTADSVITDVATTNTIVTCTTGTAFVAKQLVRFTGFGVSGNNGIFACTTGSATVPRFVGSGITNEAVPAAAAKMKVVGFIGDSADINATATGLSSTTTDFTTFGLAVGQWVKIGGTAAGTKFVTTALNDWVRITAITATALTFDNRPSGWTTETGTAITLKVWFGDRIINGITQTSMSIERGFLGQTTPVYIVNTGMVVGQLQHTFASRQKVMGSATFTGMGGSQSTTVLDASYDIATTGNVMAGNANVGKIFDNGSSLTSPNWAKSMDFTINNNLRTVDDVTSQSPAAVREGDCVVTGTIDTYFGDNTLLAKFYAGTASSLSTRVAKDSQALIYTLPAITYRGGGNPNATAKATDTMLSLQFQSSYDSVTGAHICCDRLNYYE